MTIEQLAKEYRAAMAYANTLKRQAQEARDLCDKALMELEAAFSALGFKEVACIPLGSDPKLNITDWRDLQAGDRIRCVGGKWKKENQGKIMTVHSIEGQGYLGDLQIAVINNLKHRNSIDWGGDFEFISRP